MAKLDHMLVTARDKTQSAAFLAGMLGLPAPVSLGKFLAVVLDGVSLDFCDVKGDISPQHYAFAVSEAEFDAVMARVHERRMSYWADPQRTRLGEIGERGRERAIYFEDPSGHWLEVLTKGG
jgi:catechol 2,3-dioxygenase-like lactoylglutathione lyase family enzyme